MVSNLKIEEVYMYRYSKCNLCPRGCNVDRSRRVGMCNSTDKCNIVRAALHHWEEPCISGKNGSGTIFFTGCNLGCVFCQNYEISDGKSKYGMEVSVERLVEIFFELQDKGAHNINFVTPTHYMPHIRSAIRSHHPRPKSESYTPAPPPYTPHKPPYPR